MWQKHGLRASFHLNFCFWKKSLPQLQRQVQRWDVTGDVGNFCGNYIQRVKGSPKIMNYSGSLVWMRVNSATKPQINAFWPFVWKKKLLWEFTHMGHVTTKAIKASGWPHSHRSWSQTWVKEKSQLQKYLVYVSPVHKPSYRLKETSFKCYPRLSASGSFLYFSILFFSSPLDLFLSEICMRACAEQTWGVNSRNQRKPSVRNKRWICLLLSIFCFIPPPRLSLWTSWAWRSLRFKNTKNSVAEVHLNWRQTHRNRLRLRL